MNMFDAPYLVFALLFLTSLVILEIGYRLASWTRINDDKDHHDQIARLRDSLLVLFSLILGFTFAIAISHFEMRRQLLMDEANAIGTTSLRARTLPDSLQSTVTQLLRQYTDARVDFSRAGSGTAAEQAAVRRSKDLQNALWEQTIILSRQDRTALTSLFVQAVNETIDLSEKRLAARENRIPSVIWILISVIVVLASFTSGYGLASRFWFPAVMMPLMFAAAVALIADLDSPTHGFIRTGQNSLVRLQQDLAK